MPMGNLRSAWNAIHESGFDPRFVEAGDDFDGLTRLVVPGVGNFSAVMRYLEDNGLAERLRNFAQSGRPLLGICAGMQLLALEGSEGGMTPGLGLVPSTNPSNPTAVLPAQTDAEWVQRAIDLLQQWGWDPNLLATTLGKYIGRQPLSPQEQDIVRTAQGSLGLPPGLQPIIPIGTPATPTPPIASGADR